MDCLSVFNPSSFFILSLNISLSFSFLSLLFPLNTHSFFFFSFRYGYIRGSIASSSHCSPSQYLPKYYHDRKPKNKEMDPAEFTEFLKRLSPLGVQWVVEWGCITDMVNCGFKDNCVPLVGLYCCSYYSTCCIARQFSDCQWAPSDDGSFHTLAFTERVLGRICETCSRRMITRDARFPQFLHPTLGYKDWFSTDMRLVYREEKDYKKSNKRKRTDWLPWYAPNFTFQHFMIHMSFLLSLIKD